LGENATGVILRSRDVVALQFFLMDAAKRYAVAIGTQPDAADDLLASAAALDYPVMLSKQNGEEAVEPSGETETALREILTRAGIAALDFTEKMLRAPDDAFDDFVERHVNGAGIFQLLRALRRDGAIASDDVGFRSVTLSSDVLERRSSD
jgi:hypothetical protein